MRDVTSYSVHFHCFGWLAWLPALVCRKVQVGSVWVFHGCGCCLTHLVWQKHRFLWDHQFRQRWNLHCCNLSWSSLGREWMQTAVTILPSLPIPMVMLWESTNLQSTFYNSKSKSPSKEEATRSTSLGFIQRLEWEEFKSINNTCTASCRSLTWGSTIDLSTSRTEEVNMFTIG